MNDTRKAEVMANEKSLLAAMKSSDLEALDRLLHDQLLFNGPDGKTATKAIDLENYRSGKISLQTVESSDQILSMIGDDVIVAVTVEIIGNYLGQAINGKFRYLRVWQRFETNWQVIAGSVVMLSAGS